MGPTSLPSMAVIVKDAVLTLRLAAIQYIARLYIQHIDCTQTPEISDGHGEQMFVSSLDSRLDAWHWLSWLSYITRNRTSRGTSVVSLPLIKMPSGMNGLREYRVGHSSSERSLGF